MADYVLALDQGTTSSRAILFDRSGSIISAAQKEFPQILPSPGHVEHDPQDIWQSQIEVAREAIAAKDIATDQIAAIGITNQRETTILWDKQTGEPIDNAIVWQSRITAPICEELKKAGHEETIRAKTGLVVDAYFAGTKAKYLLDKHKGLRQRAEQGEILFGTVDSYLIWKLTAGKVHVTDVGNASRTMLFNIHTLDWDDELLKILDVPRAMLPELRDNSEVYGETESSLLGGSIPIAGCAGDQHAAMFGQACFTKGSAKNTYGTGCFLLLNIGDKPVESKSNLLTTVAWKIGDSIVYALEGSVFVGGAVVQWLRDGLGIIENSADVEKLAGTVDSSEGVYIVPAFVGLGAPHWDPYARGSIIGITRGTTAGHIARAAVDSMAYQTRDLIEAMKSDSGLDLKTLKVDGGASINNALMQFQSDILDCNVQRPVVAETTALGAAYLAGLAVGFWKDLSDVEQNWQLDKEFTSTMDHETRNKLCTNWERAVERSLGWEAPE